MSTLSKIFVVLTLLLSIGYCVAAAFLYAYSQDYKAMYEKEQADHAATVEKKDEEISGLNSDIVTLTGQNVAFERDSEKLKRDNSDLNSKLTEKQQAFKDLDQAYKTLNESHMTLTRTADDLKNNLKAEQEKVNRLRELLAKSTGKNDALTKEMAVLKDDKDKIDKKLLATRKELHKNDEKLKEYENVLLKLESIGIDVPSIIIQGGEPIHGQVLAVDPETDLVVISIGKNGHVTKGMKLSVYREDDFVGSLSVISVFADMSSARILRDLTPREVQPGDNVTNQF